MRNSSDGSDNWGKIFFNFDVVSVIEGRYFRKTIRKFRRKQVFFRFDATTTLISFRFRHDSNPRMGIDFVSTTRTDTLNNLFLCSGVSEHLPITGILELL